MVKDGYIENEFGSIDLNSFEFVMREWNFLENKTYRFCYSCEFFPASSNG